MLIPKHKGRCMLKKNAPLSTIKNLIFALYRFLEYFGARKAETSIRLGYSH
jgi:hypothetical protein